MSSLLHNTYFTVFAYFTFLCRHIFRFYRKRKRTSLAEDFLNIRDQFLFTTFCQNRRLHKQFHSMLFRKSNLCGTKGIIEQYTVSFQFFHHRRAISLKKKLRCILRSQCEFLNHFYRHRDTGKKLTAYCILKKINIFLLYPLSASDIDSHMVFCRIDGNLCDYHFLQKCLQLFIHYKTWKDL